MNAKKWFVAAALGAAAVAGQGLLEGHVAHAQDATSGALQGVVPGRTFLDALGAAAGSQGDDLGVAFSGSTSLENQYYVDGVNTTGLTYGTAGSAVINNFIEEIEVITGGYDAEYGRATGGVVNVVTKSGSNEFKGSVFGYYQPGFLTAAAERTPQNATSIDITGNV